MTTNGKPSRQAREMAERLLEQFAPLLERAVNDGYKRGAEDARRTLAQQLAGGVPFAAKRDKTVKGSIECPVPGCKRPGVKPLRNFCREHDEKLTVQKKEELRKAQIERRAASHADKKSAA